MAKFIKVIKTGIDVSKVTEQLRKNPGDWDHQKKSEGVRSLVDEHVFDYLPISNLQLTICAVKKKTDFVGDSELSVNTPAYKRHTEIFKLIKEDFGDKEKDVIEFLVPKEMVSSSSVRLFVLWTTLPSIVLIVIAKVCIPAFPPIEATIGIRTASATTFSMSS